MRKGTLRDCGLPPCRPALLLPLAAIVVALFLGSFTDAHAANPGRTLTFAGATSQHSGSYGTQRLPSNGVAFAYTGGSLKNFSIPWVAPCVPTQGGHGPQLLDRIELLDALTVKHSSFVISGSYTFSPGRNQKAAVLLTLRGTIRGSHATGTLSVAAQVSWDKQLVYLLKKGALPNVAECDTMKVIHWSTVATRQPAHFAFPVLARPQSPPQPLASVMFARTGTAPGTSSIYYTWRDGPPSWRFTQAPPAVSDSDPTTAVEYPLVAFQRTTGGTTQIFAKRAALDVNIDALPGPGLGVFSARVLQLTRFPAGADDPALSPNGKEIAFSVGTGADCSIWLMDQFGHGQRQLTNQTASLECDDEPTWSPDGNFIVFRRTQMDASTQQTAVTYMVVPATGGAPRTLNLPATVAGLSWAPGTQLAFISTAGPNGLTSLQTANPDGSDDSSILTAFGLTGQPAWSPDGDTIAFTQHQSNGTTDIATVPASGGEVTDITDTPSTSESDPVWAVPVTISPEISSRPIPVKSSPTRRRKKGR